MREESSGQEGISKNQEKSVPSDAPGLNVWRELVETILPALCIALMIYLFLGRAITVKGQSMEPNLHGQQRLIIDLVSYRFRPPQRGEIIIFDVPESVSEIPLIKRIMGIPGDTVETKQGAAYLNGQRLDEPYLAEMTMGRMIPRLVPEGHVFVLGDNRNHANDSRYFGMVPYDHIIGRAWISYWPIEDVGLLRLPLATFSNLSTSPAR